MFLLLYNRMFNKLYNWDDLVDGNLLNYLVIVYLKKTSIKKLFFEVCRHNPRRYYIFTGPKLLYRVQI